MAVGEKRPVVMGAEKAAPNGVATLGADGKLVEDQRPDATGMGAADRTLSNLTDPQTALYNLGAGVRPNLLINGNFRVNQRKKTVYNSAGITVDGWCITADTVTVNVTDNGISYKNTNGAGDSYYLQKIPVSEMELNKPYTASVLFQSGSPAKYVEFVCYHPGEIGYTVFAGNSVDADGISTVTFTPPASTTSMEFRACSADYGETGEFTAICAKLEQGETQTLARQTSNGKWEQIQQPENDYATQLLKCQKYFQLYSSAEARPNSPIDCRPVMRTPEGGSLTQGSFMAGDVTYYYNSAEL